MQLVSDPAEKYIDLDRELDQVLEGRNKAGDLAGLVEKHQIRVSPGQRKVLLYLLCGTPRMVNYAYQWLDLAGREGNAGDFIALQQAQTLAIPEQNRNLTFAPGVK
jgi:hypothetical protein